MILEVAVLPVLPGQTEAFEPAFRQASPLIASIPGYRAHTLQRCLEASHRYLLHHFYEPFPTVEHFEAVQL